MSRARVILKSGHDRPVRRHHPWIFSGAIARIEGHPEDGDIVDVYTAQHEWLARGYLNRRSQIAVRLLTWNPEETIDEMFWLQRLQRAVMARRSFGLDSYTNAYRLVFAESDWIPGLIVDRYADFLVIQALTMGIERRKGLLVHLLTELCHPAGIYERSDLDVREKEGLGLSEGVRAGEAPPERIVITEYGLSFAVDVRRGQKTGFYLDQRENRHRTAAYLHGKRVLNVFSYTGAFAVAALAGGASYVVNVDSSAEALNEASSNLSRNGFDSTSYHHIEGDAFRVLRRLRATGDRFEAVILDPPKFAFSQAQLERAARGYKDINLQAFQLLEPGGILATFSCSGLVSIDLFQKIVFGAAEDAGREVQILERLGHPPDHPVRLSFPEGEYLKGLLCQVW